jgi:hypothetical protein
VSILEDNASPETEEQVGLAMADCMLQE